MSGAERAFGPAAQHLSGLAARLLGWRPAEFWQATPAELAAAGIVDRAFPGYAEQCARAGIACSVLTRTDIDRAIS